MLTRHTVRSFGFPNARREEVDRLRVAVVFYVRGLGWDTLSLPRLRDMLLIVEILDIRTRRLDWHVVSWMEVVGMLSECVVSPYYTPSGREKLDVPASRVQAIWCWLEDTVYETVWSERSRFFSYFVQI